MRQRASEVATPPAHEAHRSGAVFANAGRAWPSGRPLVALLPAPVCANGAPAGASEPCAERQRAPSSSPSRTPVGALAGAFVLSLGRPLRPDPGPDRHGPTPARLALRGSNAPLGRQ